MKIEVYDYDPLTDGKTFLKSFEPKDGRQLFMLNDIFWKMKENRKRKITVSSILESFKFQKSNKKFKEAFQFLTSKLSSFANRIVVKLEGNSQELGIYLYEEQK